MIVMYAVIRMQRDTSATPVSRICVMGVRRFITNTLTAAGTTGKP